MNYYNYFTEIEEHFVRRRGKNLFVSPLDWSLIATWRDSQVPLHVALRGIDIAMDTYHSKSHVKEKKLSTLFYCHPSVMEEFARHIESHVGEAKSDPEPPPERASAGPERSELLSFLENKITEIKSLFAKQSIVEKVSADGIERILARLGEIADDLQTDRQMDYEAVDRDLGILDESLLNELRAALAPEQMDVWEKEARKDLKVYRSKLPKETYGKILDNYLRTRIHRHFGIGELSLFQI
jgi:hypothetical protein